MKKWTLYGIWGCLYAACAAVGLVMTEPAGLQLFGAVTLSLLFFVPPALLLVDAWRKKDRKGLRVLRWISGLWLALTLVLLVANVASALGSEALGNALYVILALVSVPMISGQNWFLSMFLWACIFFVTLEKRKK